MINKLVDVIDLLISFFGIGIALFILNNYAKTVPNKTINGIKIQVINNLGIIGLVIFLILLFVKLFE